MMNKQIQMENLIPYNNLDMRHETSKLVTKTKACPIHGRKWRLPGLSNPSTPRAIMGSGSHYPPRLGWRRRNAQPASPLRSLPYRQNQPERHTSDSQIRALSGKTSGCQEPIKAPHAIWAAIDLEEKIRWDNSQTMIGGVKEKDCRIQ
jgi:hypothetical protein